MATGCRSLTTLFQLGGLVLAAFGLFTSDKDH